MIGEVKRMIKDKFLENRCLSEAVNDVVTDLTNFDLYRIAAEWPELGVRFPERGECPPTATDWLEWNLIELLEEELSDWESTEDPESLAAQSTAQVPSEDTMPTLTRTSALRDGLVTAWSALRDARSTCLSYADDAIRRDLAAVKKALGLSGLKVTFFDDSDNSGVALEVRDPIDDSWNLWDEYDEFEEVRDRAQSLAELHTILDVIGQYIEWNGKEVIV